MEPKPWSISSLTDFHNCPKAYYEKRIAKSVEDPPNQAGLWGDEVHKGFEAYLRAKNDAPFSDHPLPDNLAQYSEYLNALASLPGESFYERKYAITTKMEPCDFFAPDVWCRCILDVLNLRGEEAYILDHKTGKRKPGSQQLKLNALLVFIHHPEVQTVHTTYAWLADKKFDREVYHRADYEKMWQDFLPLLRPYMIAHQMERFGPKPSGLCNGWCPVTTCEFWKPKR